ncbi:MAG TPA: LamG domain-containing protein [Verrucomicrobiae bacterium]
MKPINLLAVLATQMMLIFAATQLRGQSLSYSNAVENLNAAGYWPMHEVEAAAPGDIETNYGTLGALGNAYYPDWSVNSGAFVRQTPGPLANGADTAVHFTEPVNNSGGFTNSLIVPHTSPLVTLAPPFSIEMWYMISNLPVAGFQGDIISECNLNKDQGIRVYFQNSGTNQTADGFNLFFYNTTTVNQGFQININGAVTNAWHYMVFTVDTNLNVTGYLDTALASGNGNNPRTIPAGRFNADSHDPLTIGNGLGNLRGFNGFIGEVAIYTNALSVLDISNRFNIATNASSSANAYYSLVTSEKPLLYYQMNSSPYTPPSSSTWPLLNNYGTVGGNGVYTPGTTPGSLGGSAYNNFPGFPYGLISTNVAPLNGVSSFADIGGATAYNPSGTMPFTVSAIFRGNPTDTNRVQTIVGHGTNSWELNIIQNGYIAFNSGTDDVAAVGTGTGAGDLVSTSSGYDDGSWHQVVAVHNGNVNTLYVDGLPNNTNMVGANGVGNLLDMMIGSDPVYTNDPIGWGASIARPAGVGAQFDGQICDVAFFGSALTLSQVQSLYNASLIPPTIKQQPISAAVGANAAFTNTVVLAGGSGPLSYQWYTNGVPIPWATNLSFVLNPVVPIYNNPDYYLIVTNFIGSVTSQIASLVVYSNVVFSAQFPVTYTNPMTLFAATNILGTSYFGSSPSFSILAVGAVPIAYQWWTNGVADGVATGAGFSLTNCTVSSPTNIFCTLSNSFGVATSMVWSVNYTFAPTAPFPQAVLAAQPIAYWRLDEPPGPNNSLPGDAGIICNDFESGNNGIYTNVDLGNPTYSPTTDPTETSASFAYNAGTGCFAGMVGTNIDFSVPSGGNGEFSVALWANGQDYVQPGNAGLVTKGYFNGEELNVDEGGAGGTVRLEVRDAAGGDHVATNSYKLSSDANWHLIVGVCDEANGNLLFYLDGRLAGRGAINPGSGVYNSAAVPLMIGARDSTASSQGNNQFNGFLDDVSVYKYALSPGQVTAFYDSVGNTVAPYFFPTPPTNASAGINRTLTIPATAYGTPALGYVWTNVTQGGVIASGTANGTTLNATLNYPNVPASWNTNRLELIVSNAYGVTNAFFTLSLTNAIATNPTNIVATVKNGNQLVLSWPFDHTGWQLQVQTNPVTVGITPNWITVPNSATTDQITVPIILTNGCVFYRLMYP